MNSQNNNAATPTTVSSSSSSSSPSQQLSPLIGVLALQGAFEEHQKCLEAIGCRTVQVRTPQDLENLDGIILPGGESTAMGLIGTACLSNSSGNSSASKQQSSSLWDCLRDFGGCSSPLGKKKKPMWGTCAGMILLAENCVGTSAVIENGQALIGGMNVLVCRNYFGSQVSSFEMPTPAPPSSSSSLGNSDSKNESSLSSPTSVASTSNNEDENHNRPFPGIFIRAPAILSAGPDVEVLGRVVATPCRQAAIVLQALEDKINKKKNDNAEEKKESSTVIENDNSNNESNYSNNNYNNNIITLPGAAAESGARQVICAVRRDNLLCTAFHPELTDDYRWHEYFVHEMVLPNRKI